MEASPPFTVGLTPSKKRGKRGREGGRDRKRVMECSYNLLTSTNINVMWRRGEVPNPLPPQNETLTIILYAHTQASIIFKIDLVFSKAYICLATTYMYFGLTLYALHVRLASMGASRTIQQK